MIWKRIVLCRKPVFKTMVIRLWLPRQIELTIQMPLSDMTCVVSGPFE